MRIERCLNGHFYDGEGNNNCPYCNSSLVLNAIPERFQKLGDITFIGVGSTSQVFKISGEQEYALKIVQCGSSESKYQNALYELKIMEKLNGEPYTVHLCDYEIIDTESIRTIYMLEEYHRTMSNYLSGNTLYVAELLQIVIGVCDALITCIESGVLHLDVQPKNIFVDNQSRILLGDFSHSLFISDLKSNQVSRGTLAFMAPEVYQKGYCSERSDLYSLGLILFSLFNNRILPFMDSDTEEVSIYKRLAGAHFPKIHLKSLDLENEINRIIGKACAYDLKCRYKSLTGFKNDLCRLYELVGSEPEKNFVIYAKNEDLHKHILPGINAFDADSIATSVIASFGANSVVASETTVFDADPIATTAALSDLDWPNGDWNTSTAEDVITARHRAPAEALRAGDKLRVELDGSITHHSRESDENDDVNNAGERIIVPDGKLAGGNLRRCRVCDNPIERNDNYCPYCGSKVVVDRSDVDISKVEFSAIAPKQLIRGDYSIIHVIMYENTSRHIVESLIKEMGEPAQESRSGIHIINEGSWIKIVLSSSDITIDENVETGVWQGDHLNFSFTIYLPENFKKRQLLFTASVFINDVIACKLKFIVKCSTISDQKIAVSRQDVFSAFVSYASQDRNRVAAIIQGMKKARPDLDVFFDVESLRSGDDWEYALYREIDKRDILFLCWSHFARDSKWVNEEWRYAFEKKGIDGIEPVPIESPDVCPPPEELKKKHFNDKLLYIINDDAAKTAHAQNFNCTLPIN